MRVLFVLSAAAALTAAPAHAGETYGKLFGGAVLGTDHDFTAQLPGPTIISGNYDTDTGYNVGGALGYNFSKYLSLEGEVAYRSNDINFGGAPFAGDDNLNALSLMANGVLSAPTTGGFTPYVGVGAGGVRLAAANDNDLAFAYQAFGGVRTNLTPNLSAGVEYRYLNADDATFGDPAAPLKTEYDSHSVNFVLSRKF